MIELELTLMSHMGEPLPYMDTILREFEAEHGIRVHLTMLGWDTGRTQLVDYALFKNSPDVSEIGLTWLSSLMALGALRPFTPAEVNQIGGSHVFFPPSWASCRADDQVVGIPWITDTRVIYYRRDLLAAVGVEEQTAFQTPEQMVKTLKALKNSDILTPWVTPTRYTPEVLHMAASWIWAAGGQFMSSDGRFPRFNEPSARTGFYHYFIHQFPYMTPAAYNRSDAESFDMFAQGQAAATISGYWGIDVIEKWGAPAVRAYFGVAPLPFPAFVGGSNLVVWRYGRYPQEALKLVQYLTSLRVQRSLLPQMNLLPAHIEAFQLPPFEADSRYQTIFHSLQTGQALQAIYLWGMVEERLVATLSHLWQELFKTPNLNLQQTIDEELNRVAKRLERTLSSSN